MKPKLILTINLLACYIFILSSCVKDKTNYSVENNDKLTITFKYQSLQVFIGDSVNYQPLRKFKDKNDSVFFDHAWYMGGKLYSTDPVFKYFANEVTTAPVPVKYYMTDRRTGIVYTPENPMLIAASSGYLTGWSVLYEDPSGNADIAHIAYNPTLLKYVQYTGLYQKANNEPLGTGVVKIYPYVTKASARGIFVIKRGGEGSLDISGTDFKKKLVAAKSFTRETPNPFEPIDVAFFNSADLLVNSNGDTYARFFSSNIAFTYPWISTPIGILKGMKITDIWDTWTKVSYLAIMYDWQNKRMLYADGWASYPGGGIDIKPIPQPAAGYPVNYTSLQDFGDWQYIWGNSFTEGYDNSLTGGILMRSPVDHRIYFQSFDFKLAGASLIPKTRIPFLGSDLVDNLSQYLAIKNRNYLFFTAAGNKDLYFFDTQTGVNMKIYQKFADKITSIAMDETSATIAVGLENGTAIIYDISNAVLNSGTSKELYRISNLGKIIQVRFKGAKV